MVFGVIVAGGTGTRMGAELPKQFLKVGDIPVIVRTVRKFTGIKEISHTIVLVPEKWKRYTEDLFFGENDFNKSQVSVIPGGESRNDTIRKAVEYISEKYTLDNETIIITHDSVRPFVTERIISENIRTVEEDGACTTAIPSTDTVFESRDGKTVTGNLDRSVLYNCQTPQSFRAKQWYDFYTALSPEKKKIYTDATAVLMDAGERVSIVPGETFNIKITYPGDLVAAEALAADLD